MSLLTLAVKAVYFDQIVAGTKTLEFRLCTPYWRKRLEGRTYDAICITKGYPARNNLTRRHTVPWRGYTEQTITHEFFGAAPVDVFAIQVGDPS